MNSISVLKRVLVGLIGVCAIFAVGLFGLAWQPAIAPIDRPDRSAFAIDLVAKGQVLASAGYCATCHTASNGALYAGGFPLPTPFGTIYSTNITPEPDTGIGRWSEAAFARALHEGVARDGSHLFPAFPYDHFTKLTADDVKALYAYFMSVPPIKAAPKANTVPFPFDVRFLQAGWKLLFFNKGPYRPIATQSADWNRGAYLAEGLSHCGACHTPRNELGAEKAGSPYGGAFVDGWTAPPLIASPSPAPWNEDELFAYLRNGGSALHGTAAGSMSPVVHGLAKLPDSDIRAIAIYFADLNGSANQTASSATATALRMSALGSGQEYNPDARLYAAACSSCHYNAGLTPLIIRPELALNSTLWLDAPNNFIRVVLEGIRLDEGLRGVAMPGFHHLSDSDIARIGAYMRRTRTTMQPWPHLEATVSKVRADPSSAGKP
jgi:mono/diheme cytochrome c family protein